VSTLAIIVVFVFVAVIYIVAAHLTLRLCISLTRGVPGGRYRETEAEILDLYIVKERSDGHHRYRRVAYAIVGFEANGRAFVSMPYDVASDYKLVKVIENIDKKFGDIPLSITFDEPLKTPKDVEKWVEKNADLQEITALRPRNSPNNKFPLLYNTFCPALFDFTHSIKKDKPPLFAIFFLILLAAGSFILFMSLGELTDFNQFTRFAISTLTMLTSPLAGYLFPGFFVKAGHYNFSKSNFHITINESFSQEEMMRQVKEIFANKKPSKPR
jgi:hypothetical protein